MRIWTAGLIMAASAASMEAQSRNVVEIGTAFGAVVLNGRGSTVTLFQLPGHGILGQPMMYATFFPTPELLFEPQMSLAIGVSGSGSTISALGMAGQLGYVTTPGRNFSYVAANIAYLTSSGGGGAAGVGGAVGYRARVGSSFAIRIEGRYRRWIDNHLNEIAVGIGLGGVISGS